MISKDKILHFVVSAILAFVFCAIFKDPVIGGILALLIGVGKEAYQLSQDEHSAEEAWRDILANFLGVLAGIGAAFLSIH
jgi:uncharacterized membrane protein HdeD (DUF308 family)